ncbi:MAG: hypothetical protein ACI865_000563 [Flavobacteriaceae bacterium]|jgi:hypothetical protein
MKQLLILSLALAVLSSCTENSEKSNADYSPEIDTLSDVDTDTDTSAVIVPEPVKKNYSFKVLLNETGNEWGYQIFDGSQMMIKQMHIPAIQGNYGFDTKEKAEITASFILDKLQNDIFPPAVNQAELDSLGVLPVK